MKKARFAILILAFYSAAVSAANVYYVSPHGDDSKDGKSAASAWKTCGKANGTALEPGDSVLFERGAEWREQMRVSSSGTAGKPVTYDAYGKGEKPRFLGSDVVPNASFTAGEAGKFSFKIAAKAEAVLQDHEFVPATWNAGVATISVSGTDPRTNGKVYTVCTRGNVVLALAKKYVVLRNLVADETAGQLDDGVVQGYGFRIEGGSDVLVEDCEAYRCGRHHFGAINTANFIGRRLHAAYVHPNTPGGNTFYVAYADENAPAKCNSEWHNITADHLEDGKNGMCLFFVTHGPKVGSVLISNVDASSKMSFMSAPVTIKGGTIRGGGSIESFGVGTLIDSVTFLDNAAVDQWGADGIIQNCIASSMPTNNGPTGYSSVFVMRDKAKNNLIRFNTMDVKRFACLTILGRDSSTKWQGNIMLSENQNPVTAPDTPAPADADYNFYSPNASICGKPFAAWKAAGFDAHSALGDPKFIDAPKKDYRLQVGSPCIDAAKVAKDGVPGKDFAGTDRPKGAAADIGAFESDK